MPQSYHQAVAGVLLVESGAVFKFYYPDYSVYVGTAQGLPRGGTTRFNISTQSLDMVISTFQVQDRGTQQAPILGLWAAISCLQMVLVLFLVILHLVLTLGLQILD